MEWINKNGVEILKDNPNYEVLGSGMYVGMYAFYYNGVENEHFYNISSAKKYAEEFYNCKKILTSEKNMLQCINN